jgi:hypothetical protein
MLATGPLLVTPVQFRNVNARIDRIRDETAPIVNAQLLIKNITLESRNQYYTGNNDSSLTISLTVNGGPPSEGVVAIMSTNAGTVTKTQGRGTDITFNSLDEDSGVKYFTVADVALGARWNFSVDIKGRRVLYNSASYYIGQSVPLQYVWYDSIGKLYINDIRKETTSQSYYYNISNNDAISTFTFYSSDDLPNQGVIMTVDYSANLAITKTAAREVPITFNGQDEQYGTRLVTVSDVASNGFWRMTLDIYNRRVQYGNKFYYPGEYIIFNRVSTENNGLITLTLTNIRSGVTSLTCDGKILTSSTSTKEQTFQLSGLDGNRTTPYPITVRIPHLNKTYNMEAYVGFKTQSQPVYPIKTYVRYQNENYGEGALFRLK